MFDQIIRSSQDPTKLSLTVKGIMLSFVPFIIFVSRTYGLEGVDESFVTQVIEMISLAIQQGLALISVLVMTWGLIRKVLIPGPNDKKWDDMLN